MSDKSISYGHALGMPGLAPDWAPSHKTGVGTALSARSRVWFTIADGVLTECYYPRVDTPNMRDLQFLILDANGGFQEERRDLVHTVRWIEEGVLAYLIMSEDPGKRFRLTKQICTDSERDSLLIHLHFEVLSPEEGPYRLFLLWAPQIGNTGMGNHAVCQREPDGTDWCLACRDDITVALTGTTPFVRMSAGYVGASDGWQDLHYHHDMHWTFSEAGPGHVALTAELDLGVGECTLALGFGASHEQAMAHARFSLTMGFISILREYSREWLSYQTDLLDLSPSSEDHGKLYRRSVAILRCHFDKEEPGAGVASLSIPWGEQSDATSAQGGYHLVWPRDLYHLSMGLLAAGDCDTPVQTWHYLQRRQNADGSWPQNFWVDGTPYWRGLQLDEVAYPILLAWRLFQESLIPDPSDTVHRAADFLVSQGPVTPQDRWEENRGYSPQTLAVVVAALRAASQLCDSKKGKAWGCNYHQVADSWGQRIEEWTFTHCGRLLPGHPDHYERIAQIPVIDTGEHLPECRIFLPIRYLPPEAIHSHSQCCVVDGGFLSLVRLGLRRPDDPHVLKTLPVWDGVCRQETPCGPCWYRYNGDGYGEHGDGDPFDGLGQGRLWPLLTGERGHFAIAAGEEVTSYIRALECFANEGGCIPEQIWDQAAIPAKGLYPGRGTGSATPLAWAHAEYIRLLRSRKDGVPFDRPAFNAEGLA